MVMHKISCVTPLPFQVNEKLMRKGDKIAPAKEVRTLLIDESLDVGAGLLRLLLVIEHICKPAPTWFLLSTQHSCTGGFTKDFEEPQTHYLNPPLPTPYSCTGGFTKDFEEPQTHYLNPPLPTQHSALSTQHLVPINPNTPQPSRFSTLIVFYNTVANVPCCFG